MNSERAVTGTPPWSEVNIRAALGLLALAGRPPLLFSEISTDTRTLQPGALFVALKGERFDAHEHLGAAAAGGAAAAVVRRGSGPVAGLVLLEVDDTLRAYGTLAHARRTAVAGAVIGRASCRERV